MTAARPRSDRSFFAALENTVYSQTVSVRLFSDSLFLAMILLGCRNLNSWYFSLRIGSSMWLEVFFTGLILREFPVWTIVLLSKALRISRCRSGNSFRPFVMGPFSFTPSRQDLTLAFLSSARFVHGHWTPCNTVLVSARTFNPSGSDMLTAGLCVVRCTCGVVSSRLDSCQ